MPDYESQLNELAQKIEQYTPTSLNEILPTLMSKVDFFRPQIAEQRSQEATGMSSIPAFLKGYYDQQQANGGLGPSAFTVLNNAMNNTNRYFSTANAISDAISKAGGRIEDLANTALGTYQNQRQALLDKYNMISPLFQADQARKAAAAAAAAYNSNYGNSATDTTGQGLPVVDLDRQAQSLSDYIVNKPLAAVNKMLGTNLTPGQAVQGLMKAPFAIAKLAGFTPFTTKDYLSNYSDYMSNIGK